MSGDAAAAGPDPGPAVSAAPDTGPDTRPDTGPGRVAAFASVAAPGEPVAAGGAGGPARPPFDRRMLEALVCPVTQGRLRYDAAAGELVSTTARLAFPIRNGIPVMLASEARELD